MKPNKYSNITDIVQRRTVFLHDTVAHYNINNRCSESIPESMGRCKYYPSHSNTQGCAIGRHLPAKLAASFDKEGNSSVSNDAIFYRLPKWMKEMGMEFLMDVQNLHDCSKNWNENGLTSKGSKSHANICQKYCHR